VGADSNSKCNRVWRSTFCRGWRLMDDSSRPFSGIASQMTFKGHLFAIDRSSLCSRQVVGMLAFCCRIAGAGWRRRDWSLVRSFR
jgi:hypothetical protein